MKKVLKNIILVLFLLVLLVGCGKDKDNKDNILEVKDKNMGYKTTFELPEDKGYKVTKVDNKSGASVEVTLVNEKKNIEATIYYYSTVYSVYSDIKDQRKQKENFKEYTLGESKYKAYSYTSYDNLQANILLSNKNKKEDKVMVLYINMEKYDNSKNVSLNSVFNSKEFQNILNTITVTKITK